MQYLLDTNAIIRHFANIGKLGKNAKKIILQGENNNHQLMVSIISLMEIMYLAEKNRIPLTLKGIIHDFSLKKCYSIVDLDIGILNEAANIKFYELHDRLILATAKFLGVPIVSSDGKFTSVDGIEVIW